MKGKRLVVNTVLMTAASILMRSVGLWFQVLLSRRMGAAGIGRLGLVTSVGSLAATFAISGIRFTTTRLVSEEMGRGRLGDIPGVVRRCLGYGTVTGLLAGAVLYLGAETVAERFLGDIRTALALRVLALGMPFIPAGAVLGGYFTGLCKVGRALIGTVSEELSRIAVALAVLGMLHTADVELMCAGAAAGSAAGEIFSFFVLLILYALDRRGRRGRAAGERGQTRRMLAIAMPLALTAYARVALNTVQNLLIPSGLRRSGATAEAALAGYGVIQGMVFPVITFPMVLFASVSELIVPELTEEQVQGHGGRIDAAANMLLRLTFTFSAAVAGGLLCFARELGLVIYQSAEVGRYIALLAPLMPAMYMDNITDGMLRGLGEHLYSMRLNIIDSLLSTALIWLVLPRFAVYGYIAILYASELFNFSLSLRRLSRIAAISQSLRVMALTALSAGGAGVAARAVVDITGGAQGVLGLVTGVMVFLLVYIILLKALGALDGAELRSIAKEMR